ncbi:nucleotidyltransferase domain-containing protein [Ureibacillus chungkukjangi]|uniref:nucleotidyltransferase domain-containing protein n=1 Tax=Ureibacillus chungkukjangi TaxID=1202712 RepID=UPI000D3A5FE6|nr:nucleotidyltransferase [Ureibacillus chungkukjangi]
MAIPNSQLETWSNQGATTTPKALREQIERVLRGENSLITNKKSVSIYLQGSYRNSTNIYGNSDVDIVVETGNVFFSDTSLLTNDKKQIYESQTNSSQYKWATYKKEVLDTLINYFGKDNVEVGNKSIKVNTGSYEADVVPCIEYREYYDYGYSEDSRKYIAGMKFLTTKENREVINFPKYHYFYGAEKNRETHGMYKKTVRIFKNIKSKLVKAGKLEKGVAPSYFVENLLYNVPNERYGKEFNLTVMEILLWLGDDFSKMSEFKCQNQITSLFGEGTEQWNQEDAIKFITECIILWNGWDK